MLIGLIKYNATNYNNCPINLQKSVNVKIRSLSEFYGNKNAKYKVSLINEI